MATIRNIVGIMAFGLFAAGLAMGPRTGLAADEPPRPVDMLRGAIEPARTIKDPARRDALLGELADALALLGAVPDAITVKDVIGNPLIRAGAVEWIAREQAERGDVAGALRSAAELDTPQAEQAGYRSLVYSWIAEALARSGDWEGAVRRARRCDPWTRARTIAEVIGRRAEKGDMDGAIKQAERLENVAEPRFRGGVDLPSPRRFAIVKLVGVLAEKNERDRADRLLAAHPDATAEGLAAIARARLKAKDMDGAAAAARRLLDQGGDWRSEAIARVVLVRALVAQDKVDAAVKVAGEPWKEQTPIGHSQPPAPGVEPLRGRALVAVARAQIEQGHLDAGLATLAKVQQGLARALDLLKLARERLAKGDRSTAERLVAGARAAMDEPTGSEFYLADVGAVMARCGQVEPARELFRRALFARDINSTNRPYVAISQAREGGDVEGAMRTIAAIPEAEARDNARLRLAVHQARTDQADAALEVAAAIGDPAVRATATAQVGMILARRGDRDRGAAACRRAADMVESPTPEVARILAHAWAAAPGEAGAALDWSRRRSTPELRVAARLGAGWGLSGRPFWWVGPSRYLSPDMIIGAQQQPTDDDLE
jgi:predicted negative regulator of RcsB-dependent stress response